jgi:pimeloyl-ACP methyl ester carboxylesterase
MRHGLAGLLAALLPVAALAAPLTPPTAWHPAVLDVPVPGGGSERALLLRPAQPRGTLVMLPGGAGEVGIADDGTMEHADNVVIRTAPLWLAQGWALLIPDAPGNLRGERASPAYGAAVSALVAEAHRAVAGPVALVGTSQGAIAAVNGAAHAPDVSRLVLLEAVSRRGGSGETVFDADPGAVTAPVLVVANAADRCPVTPPEDADRIAAAFTGSRRPAVMRVDGGGSGGRDCGSLSPHGYRGLERDVVGRVSAWLGR